MTRKFVIYCIIDIFLLQTYVKLSADMTRQDRDQWKIYANKRMKATYKFFNAEQNVYMYTSSYSMLTNDVSIKSYDGYMTRYLHASWRGSFNRSHPLIVFSIDRWKHTLMFLYKMSFYLQNSFSFQNISWQILIWKYFCKVLQFIKIISLFF